MADEKKYFDKDRQENALKLLTDKWKEENRKCDICCSQTWTIAEDLVMPMPFSGKNLNLSGPSYPQIMVICTNCGNTEFLNAVILGIEAPEDKPTERNDGK